MVLISLGWEITEEPKTQIGNTPQKSKELWKLGSESICADHRSPNCYKCRNIDQKKAVVPIKNYLGCGMIILGAAICIWAAWLALSWLVSV